MYHGKGTYTWADGREYKGDWINGNRYGKGTFTLAHGCRYEGDWYNDSIHGFGKRIHTEICCDYVEDGLIEYAGYYTNDLQHGQGKCFYKDGSYDIGTWKNDKKHGTFLCYDNIFFGT